MKKNFQIHLVVNKELFEVLKKEAEEENVNLSELCRLRLKQSSRLVKIEMMLEKINERL